jgi:hypothetical protein
VKVLETSICVCLTSKIIVFTLFEGYEKNGTSYLLGNRSTLQRQFMLRFPISVSAILCVASREFEKLFGRNKECGFHGEKGYQNEVIYSHKSCLGHLLQDFSKP